MQTHHKISHGPARPVLALFAVAFLACLFAMPAYAEKYLLGPNTKLRLKAYQLISSKGEYVPWEAISGEFIVSQTGTISLPLLGSIQVANFDATELPSELAKRLQAKINLLSQPDISIEVLEYPPVYIVGRVALPGEYRFRPGMSVLQALALGGGLYRPPASEASRDQIGLLGDLQGLRGGMLRTRARIARLQAEMSGAGKVQFPAEFAADSGDSFVSNIVDQEKILFSSRRSALERQLRSLAGLHDLYAAEIDNLQKKLKSDDTSITQVEEELARRGSLVDKGVLTASRRSELQRQIANMKASHLDLETAAMRARQNLAETTRSADGLRDQQLTAAAAELQEAQASLEQMTVRENVSQSLLDGGSTGLQNQRYQEPVLSFTIVRAVDGQLKEITASESTVLLPGDVVKVALK
jgi:DNA repair exonuclease SbcCD ATPase subunit